MPRNSAKTAHEDFLPKRGPLGRSLTPTPRRGPANCATDCLSYNLRGTLVLRTVTVNRVHGYNLGNNVQVDMRRRTQPGADSASRATRSATRLGCERNGEWLEGHSMTSAPAAAAISRWVSGWIMRSCAHTT